MNFVYELDLKIYQIIFEFFVLNIILPYMTDLYKVVRKFKDIRVFHSYKLAEMAILASKDLRTPKKLPPVGVNLMPGIITGL